MLACCSAFAATLLLDAVALVLLVFGGLFAVVLVCLALISGLSLAIEPLLLPLITSKLY